MEARKAPNHATSLTEKAICRGYRNIVAVGGDGTVNEIINGIMNSGNPEKIHFGVIPEGGGNDFAHNFELPSKIGKAIKKLKREKTLKIDVGKIENFYFINSIGIGFDAEVSINSRKIRFLNGLPRYLLAVLLSLIKLKTYEIEIKIDDKTLSSSYLMITIGNGKYCGSGFQITPNAKPADGVFDICLIDAINRRRLLKLLPAAIKGKHLGQPEVMIKRSNSVEIKADAELPVYFDGEIPELKNPKILKIQLLSKKINLIC
ncbi:MAG: diacylglycerol kinase family lipid kinase [Candidatus Cloacimonetes bacterium]|nr:diacylglycerol kinase family lipid kinase [Candidatus Cloacimonadota bacterium]